MWYTYSMRVMILSTLLPTLAISTALNPSVVMQISSQYQLAPPGQHQLGVQKLDPIEIEQVLEELVNKTGTSYQSDVKEEIQTITDKELLARRYGQHPFLVRFLLAMGYYDDSLYTRTDFDLVIKLLRNFPQFASVIYFMIREGLATSNFALAARLAQYAAYTQPEEDDEYVFYLFRGQHHPLQPGENFLSAMARKQGLEKSIQQFSNLTDNYGRKMSEEEKVQDHRSGLEGRFGVPLTSDFLAAASFAEPGGIIYRLKIPKKDVINVNKTLQDARLDDPVASLGGGHIAEYLVWHQLSHQAIVEEIPYPFVREISYGDLRPYNSLALFLERHSLQFDGGGDWRKPVFLTENMRKQVQEVSEDFVERELEKLEEIQTVDSFDDMIQSFQSGSSREAMLLGFELDETKLLEKMKVLSEFPFEISLLRIRGTSSWVAVKGTATGVQTKLAGHMILFDLHIHNHPHTTLPFPSVYDIGFDFKFKLGRGMRSLIVAKDGIAYYNICNLKNFDDAPYGIWGHALDGIHQQLVEKAKLAGIGILRPSDRELALNFWKEIFTEWGVDYEFKTWQEVYPPYFFKREDLSFTDQFESSQVVTRLSAIRFLSDLATQNKHLVPILGRYAYDTDESLQKVIFRDFADWRHGMIAVHTIADFLKSPYFSVRKLAEDILHGRKDGKELMESLALGKAL